MINEETINLFNQYIKGIYKCGSSVLDWIENPHDVDYVFYVENLGQDSRLSALYAHRPDGECWFCREKEGPAIYAYLFKFATKLYGEDIPMWDIFEHENEYKELLVYHGLGNPIKHRKFWYHILTGIYMLENGDYTLTEEQVANVRLCHSRLMTEEIYQYIQTKLSEYRYALDRA